MSQGVCSHSTISSQSEYVIFSSHDPEGVREFLKQAGIPNKELIGRFCGKLEASWIIEQQHAAQISLGGWLDQQVCVLWLERTDARGRRPAWLINTVTMNEVYIGHMTETQLGPLAWEDYSYDPERNTYWVCHKPHNAAAKPLSPWSVEMIADYLAYRKRVEQKA